MDKTETKEDLRKKNMPETESNSAAEQRDGSHGHQANPGNQPEPASETTPQHEAVDKLKEELEAAKDKYIRLYSEFENFRKRTAKEKLEMIQSANEQLIKTLLPVADDFERAENAFPDKTDKDLAGFFLIHSKFKKVLELYGLKPMEVGQGSDFNADYHEAVSQLQAPTPELRGKIVDVVEKGYLLNDKVIRYAKVVVGN